MNKILIACAIVWFSASKTFADTADSTVTIKSATESYQFVYNSKLRRVEIKKKISTSYVSDNFQANIPIVQSYDNQVAINAVTCQVDGRTPKDFNPVYEYYRNADVFYSDSKVCHFPLVIPRKGSLGVVTFDQTVNDPRYFTSIYFTQPYAVAQKQVSVKIPRWMKVELKELNFGSYNIKKTIQYLSGEDADLVTYTMYNLAATVSEDNSPGPSYVYPHLMVLCKSATAGGSTFTYFNTLDDQYSWYHSLTKNPVGDQGAITTKAKELTAGLTTDVEKVKAIYYYVQDNIRYIAFEDGLAGFRPDNADEVLRKKYGDCKGMANLTKALLTAAGYDARLCWLGTNHIAYDYQTPSLAVDNHMICALDIKGTTYFLDATESYIGFKEYAERIQGRQVLMEDGEKYQLKHVPVATMSQNISTSTAAYQIKDGMIIGSVKYVWQGEDKEQILTGINSIKKEKAEDAMIDYLSGSNNDYNITGLVLSGISNPDKDLSVSYNLRTKNGLSSFSKAYYVDMDHTKELMYGAVKAGRKTDYWFGHKADIRRAAELVIPEGYKVTYLPPALHIVNPGYEFHIEYSSTPTKVTYKKNILIKNARLAKTTFDKWNMDVEQLVKTYNDALVLKPINE